MAETSFINLPPSKLSDLVVNHDHRLERPEIDDLEKDCSGIIIPGDVWELTERCWVKEPKDCPAADAVCDRLMMIVEMRSTMNSSPPPRTKLPRPSSARDSEKTVTLASLTGYSTSSSSSDHTSIFSITIRLD